MRYRLRTLLFSSRWLRFSLRGMFVVITLFGIWLGFQVNWMRQRQEARRWIEQHEFGDWSRVDPKDVVPTRPAADAPWILRLQGETRLAYIHLDKSKLSENDISRIDSLPSLFPEAHQVQIVEPGWTTCWPPTDPGSFLKYPTRVVAGKLVNEPMDATSSDTK